MNLRYLTSAGVCLLLTGLAIVYVSSRSSARPITFPLAYLEHGALRGGPGEEPVQKKYYVNAQWQPPPERISTDKSFAFRLSFYLTDVSLREGANGPAKSVAKGEVLENGQPVRLEDFEDADFWDNVSAELTAGKSSVKPSGPEKLISSKERGKEVWSAGWTVNPSEAGTDVMQIRVQLPHGAEADFENPITTRLEIASSWRTRAGWCVTFLGSFATLPGILAFLRDRKK